MKYRHIIISRIDAIGDVTLTIPMCGYLKSLFPELKISFMGKSYTRSVINTCTAIDQFLNYDDLTILPEQEQISFMLELKADVIIHVFPNKHLASLAKKSRIPLRIGTSHRWFHWISCNKLINLGRKKSKLHEAELNLFLLKGIGITRFPAPHDIYKYYNFTKTVEAPASVLSLLSTEKFNLILHPKSHGSGKEWPLGRYMELVGLLPEEKFSIFISGSEKEKQLLKDWIPTLNKTVNDITGLMTLEELIGFIKKSDGLVACSTGPLHLAAASGIYTLGLYPSVKPLDPGRWGPVGKKAEYLESGDSEINGISPVEVFERVKQWTKDQD